MLPPGHVAGGYLTAFALIKALHPALSDAQINQLLLLGAFSGFAPDLDTFYAFFKVRSFTIQDNKISHRKFPSHTPFVWMLIGLTVYLNGQSEFVRLAGIVIWLGSWSHFVLDSIQHGIMWLWPLSKRRFALLKPGMLSKGIVEPNFFKFWLKMVRQYPTELPYTFALEILIIIISVFVFLHTIY